MSEVEDILGIAASPLNWPLGSAKEFRGIVRLPDRAVELYEKTASGGAAIPRTTHTTLSESAEVLGADRVARVQEELDLLETAGNEFRREAFLEAQVTPIFFGSALTNFGVEPLFDAFVELAPAPGPRRVTRDSEESVIQPTDLDFSAHVFKLQANMNPRHRDCVAFLRINSGKFSRDMQVLHERLQKKVRLARPHTLLVAERETLEAAYPGDIIGVISPGNFAIGDTLSTTGGFEFEKLPQFQPEHFARLEAVDMSQRKSLDKGIEQLAGEGAVQLLWDWGESEQFPFLAAVGQLQFEVMQYRLKDEYNVQVRLAPMPYQSSAWLEGPVESFQKGSRSRVVQDRFGRPMILFATPWEKNLAIKNNPDHRLLDFA
jgi:peptide chain release factor 3